MMVHPGESQVLERQVAKPLHGLIDVDLAALDLLQQLFHMFRLNRLRPPN